VSTSQSRSFRFMLLTPKAIWSSGASSSVGTSLLSSRSCRGVLWGSSGGKEKLGNISKRGDRYLRSLFTTGALAVIRYAKLHGTKHRPWLTALPAFKAGGRGRGRDTAWQLPSGLWVRFGRPSTPK